MGRNKPSNLWTNIWLFGWLAVLLLVRATNWYGWVYVYGFGGLLVMLVLEDPRGFKTALRESKGKQAHRFSPEGTAPKADAAREASEPSVASGSALGVQVASAEMEAQPESFDDDDDYDCVFPF